MDQSCPPQHYAMIGFLATLIFTFVIGLLGILVWRIVATLNDRREYALFEKRTTNPTFAEMSPIYKDPITHYNNPKFVSKSKENVADL